MKIFATTMLLAVAIALTPASLCAHQGASSSGQTANPQQPPAAPAKAKPKKKPEEPIDPDTSAGVRGNGAMHTVRVLRKGKPAEAAHVVVKNTNGSLTASCYTSASGECQVQLGPDNYVIEATRKAHAGTVSMAIDDATGTILIRLAKMKAAEDSPKP